ncbi:MAG: hypothetical protein JWO37_7 [Acidimicrobiales bacterium]|jgi:hypothetical protein|nr:hypothetical protein [Acidimicrobiales bacterium]
MSRATRFVATKVISLLIIAVAFVVGLGAGIVQDHGVRGLHQALRDEINIDGARLAASAGNQGNGNGNTNPNGSEPHRFQVGGLVTGLYPGANLPLDVTVSNGDNFGIVVQTLGATATAIDADHSQCPLTLGSGGAARRTVTVQTFGGSLVVPAQGWAVKTLRILMDTGAPTACQGARFTLTYSGSGQKQ